MEKTILIIEDDVNILRGIKDNLLFEEYAVLTAMDGISGLKLALENQIDMLLLDLMLPGENGYEVCRKVKKEKPSLPIIMITAKGTEMDKIAGLDMGADDYLTKPFSLPELLARIRAVLRRTVNLEEITEEYSFGEVKLDFKKYRAYKKGQEIKFSGKEFSIMKYLIIHEGEVVQRHELLEEVWGYQSLPDTRTVDNFILELRKKIEKDPSNPKHIISIRGVGYRFHADPV